MKKQKSGWFRRMVLFLGGFLKDLLKESVRSNSRDWNEYYVRGKYGEYHFHKCEYEKQSEYM
jgi:hypothetical protein